MANNVISTKLRTLNAQISKFYFEDNNVYIFIGKDTAWDDPSNPDDIDTSLKDTYSTYENMLALKKVLPTQTQIVIKRYNWVSGNVYNYYRDDIDNISTVNPDGSDYQFYVVTEEMNVYKCLSNNNGAPSTTQPQGQLITPFKTDDGYLWKYMYSVREEDLESFVNPDWIPVYTLRTNDGSIQWQVQQSAVSGSIENIQIEDGGSGYDRLNPPTVTVTGDGTGCTATATVNLSGQVESIEVTNAGQDYTNAVVEITDPLGTGATATAIVSPFDGHGSDPVNELGGKYLYIYVQLIGDEGGVFPTDTYRQTGMIVNPRTTETGSVLDIENARFFSVGETVTGQTTGTTATVRYVDILSNIIHVENISGSFNQGEEISNGLVQDTIVSVQNNQNMVLTKPIADASEIIDRTGDIIYTSNRLQVSRDTQQTEGIQFVVNF